MQRNCAMNPFYNLLRASLMPHLLPHAFQGCRMFVPSLILMLLTVCAAVAQGPLEPVREVKTGENHELLVNGKPFLPIMSWAQPPRNYALLRDLGFNAHAGNADPQLARENEAYAVPGFSKEKMEQNNILGWIFDDEPDMPRGKGIEARPRQEPEAVIDKARRIKTQDPRRLLFITLTGHFSREQSTYPEEFRKKIYPRYIQETDVIGFDIYPIYGSGYASHLDWVGKGVSQLRELAGDRPVYAWIETGKGSKWMSYEKQPDVLPVHTRNEVWQAIINGATAIGYFTHAWFPEFKEFAPTAEMQVELKRLNSQLTRLAPAILAHCWKRKVEMKLDGGLNGQFKATETKDHVYIFALNMDLGPGADKAKQFDPIYPRAGRATFLVAGLKAGTEIEVVDEDRTIIADKGKFMDDFAPLAEHIYKFTK